MQKVKNKHRFFRLMNEPIERMGLYLRGLTVLTEAASDSFICKLAGIIKLIRFRLK